jgi:hypothetical protein
MNDDWRSRSKMTGRDMAKAAGIILGLMVGAILLIWALTRFLH